jgi:hypothetical protein
MLFSFAWASLAASFPPFPVASARTYPIAIEKSALVVAAVPVEDRKDQQTYFGIDLRSKGFIPVFLVVENQRSDESFLLNKESIAYSPAGGSQSTLPNPGHPSKADKALTVAGAVPTIYSVMATIAASKGKELRQHLLSIELQSATISPAASIHGFIFLPARRAYSSRGTIKLTIPLTRPRANEVLTIDLAI